MKLIDSNRYHLNNTGNRFLHIASVQDGVREFMCFADLVTRQIYIEEITGGHLEFINDDALAEALHDFLTQRKVLDMSKPLLTDADWYKSPQIK